MNLCAWVRHGVPNEPPFCNEPATAVIRHWSNLFGCRMPYGYCAHHGRIVADEIADYVARGLDA